MYFIDKYIVPHKPVTTNKLRLFGLPVKEAYWPDPKGMNNTDTKKITRKTHVLDKETAITISSICFFRQW